MRRAIAIPLALLFAATCAADVSRAETPPEEAVPAPPAPSPPQDPSPPPAPTAAQPPSTATGPRGPLDPVGLVPYNLVGGSSSDSVSNPSAFNPSIAVIFDGVFYRDDVDGAGAEILAAADGFPLSGVEPEATAEGFSLRETELSFSGTVDPYFDLWAILAISGDGIEVEEAYAQTRKFIPGFQLKVGQFYSGIGYQNSQHPHQWDFVDTALPYQLIFGGALNEAGVQLNWLPPLPFYTRIGIEAAQGVNPGVSSYYGESDDTPWFENHAGPRLFDLFVKVAPDVGYSNALQIGGFYGTGRTHQELQDQDGDGEVDHAYEGSTDFWGIDVVYKYDSPKEFGQGDLTLQGEYIARNRDLDLVAVDGESVPPVPFTFDQDAYYVQAVYGFAKRWTAGVRYDQAGSSNQVRGGGVTENFGSTSRWSGDMTFNPTEFSRCRAQYERIDVTVDGTPTKVDAYTIQLQFSLGAHGAHKF